MAKRSGESSHDKTVESFEQTAPRTNSNSGQTSSRSCFRSFASYGRFAPMSTFSSACAVLGSSSNLALLSDGSTGLDPAKMMSMQEDARARRISSEIMKHRLYENVITTTRPRCLSVGPPDYNYYPFLPYSFSTHSMPVTPFRGSHETSPASTPSGSTNTHGFFRFYSRGTTPKCTTPVEENCTLEESSSTGLASLFGRYPRQGSVSRCHISEGPEMEEEETKAVISSDNRVPPWTKTSGKEISMFLRCEESSTSEVTMKSWNFSTVLCQA